MVITTDTIVAYYKIGIVVFVFQSMSLLVAYFSYVGFKYFYSDILGLKMADVLTVFITFPIIAVFVRTFIDYWVSMTWNFYTILYKKARYGVEE